VLPKISPGTEKHTSWL